MCNSCEVLNINGVRCHELGCPDSWKDYTIDCDYCESEFQPESKGQSVCLGCQEDEINGSNDDDRYEWE